MDKNFSIMDIVCLAFFIFWNSMLCFIKEPYTVLY